MSLFVITGASGFIGRALTRRCLNLGHNVILLSRQPLTEGRWIKWELGEHLPDECAEADAIFHLASATLVANSHVAAAIEKDISGTILLAQNAKTLSLADGKPRLIFLSSQSAHPLAKNAYGQSKQKIEIALMDDAVIVRPGLVYDDAGSSVFGLFKKLASVPIVPVISNAPNIQPIHVDELLACLIEIAQTPTPQRRYLLGRTVPLTFPQAVAATAERFGKTAPLMIPVPLLPVRVVAWILDMVLRVQPPIRERVDGLVALQPMDTADSLQQLGIRLTSFNAQAR